jgi:hypothetical protein
MPDGPSLGTTARDGPFRVPTSHPPRPAPHPRLVGQHRTPADDRPPGCRAYRPNSDSASKALRALPLSDPHRALGRVLRPPASHPL